MGAVIQSLHRPAEERIRSAGSLKMLSETAGIPFRSGKCLKGYYFEGADWFIRAIK